jgi:hypothetical protein
VDIDEMARISVEEITAKIESPGFCPTLKIVTGTLVVKDSAKPPNARFESNSQVFYNNITKN